MKLEDGFILECTPSYPWQEEIREPMKDTHIVKKVEVLAERFGWPGRRWRIFVMALTQDQLEWAGPESDKDVQREFDLIVVEELGLRW